MFKNVWHVTTFRGEYTSIHEMSEAFYAFPSRFCDEMVKSLPINLCPQKILCIRKKQPKLNCRMMLGDC